MMMMMMHKRRSIGIGTFRGPHNVSSNSCFSRQYYYYRCVCFLMNKVDRRRCWSELSSSSAILTMNTHRDDHDDTYLPRVEKQHPFVVSPPLSSSSNRIPLARSWSSSFSWSWMQHLGSIQCYSSPHRCLRTYSNRRKVRGGVNGSTTIPKYYDPASSKNHHNPYYNDDDDDEHDDDSKEDDESRSLHSRIHYLLKRTPIGQMSRDDQLDARAFLSIVSKWHNEKGATLAEDILERLYKEKQQQQQQHHRTTHRDTHPMMIISIDSEMYNICMDAWNKCTDVSGDRIVHRVESLMARMEERFFSQPSSPLNNPRPDRYSYNCLINAYSKWDGDSSAKVEAILIKMNALAKDIDYCSITTKTITAETFSNARMERGELEDTNIIRPDVVTYHSAMNYYASRKNNRGAAQKAEDLLLQMSELTNEEQHTNRKIHAATTSGSSNIQVNTTSFNIVLKAWRNSGGGIFSALRAEAILRTMMKLHGQGHENVKPDVFSFSTTIHSFSKVNPTDDASLAIDKVMDLLDVLERTYTPASDAIQLNSCYNAVANVIIKNGAGNVVVRQIEGLMKRMNNLDAVPDSSMLTTLCLAHVKEGTDQSFQKGKDLLVEMMLDAEWNIQPNSISFNVILDYVLKSSSMNKFTHAYELMSAMENMGGNARPDSTSYNMIISALSRSGRNDSEEKAVEYLRKMLKSYRDGYGPAKPDSFVFNCVIGMLSRSNHNWAEEVMYRTLKAMESQYYTRGNTAVMPDTITYNMVIGRLARTKTIGNANKVMSLLKHMEDKSQSNEALAPDIITYTNVLRIQNRLDPQMAASIAASYLGRIMMKHSGSKVPIDRLGFRILLQTLSRSCKHEHIEMMQTAWEWMENSRRIGTDGKELTDRGDGVLDSDLFDIMIVACNNTNNESKILVDKIYLFLMQRIDQWKVGDERMILPTVVGVEAMLVSLGKVKRFDDALHMFETFRILSRNGVSSVKPNARCYVCILNVLAQRQQASISTDVLTIMRHMNEDLGTVTTEALNLAISVCVKVVGTPNEKREALEAAFFLFQSGRDDAVCDATTYGLMIRACVNLTENENTRMKLVEPLFQLCTKSGMVGCMVVREMRALKTSSIVESNIPDARCQ